MKNIFIIFPTRILNCIFSSISLKFSWFFEARLTFMYDNSRQNLWKPLDFLMKSCKKYGSKYELEKWWKYFSSEMPEIILPHHSKCFRLCLWRNFLEKPWFFHAFSCFLLTVGFPIVNACSTPSLYRNACLLWGRGAGSKLLYLHEFLTENCVRWRDHYLRSKSFPTLCSALYDSPTCGKGPRISTPRAKSCTV